MAFPGKLVIIAGDSRVVQVEVIGGGEDFRSVASFNSPAESLGFCLNIKYK